ncbi:MAG: serine hydrolase domain-containing protein [Caldilineaceae bacterium]
MLQIIINPNHWKPMPGNRSSRSQVRTTLLIMLLVTMPFLNGCQPMIQPPEAGTASTTPALNDELFAKLDAQVEEAMTTYGVPGMALGVVKDGALVYAKGFGVAEIGSERSVTPSSIFLLSSIAKTFTSTAIMQLVAAGKVDLDGLVTDYLPYFTLTDERYRAITIRHLLSHTSGLPEYGYSEVGQDPQYDDEALERYVRSLSTMELSFAPGEGWDYSSIGYDVLGDIVAKVSGQIFERYIAEHILQPLGMNNTTFLLDEADKNLLVAPHIPDTTGNTVVSNVFPYDRIHGPDTNLYSTIEDMARYVAAHLHEGTLDDAQLLAPAAYDELWQVHGETWFPPDYERHYGLGWTLGDYKGHRLIGHGGVDIGFNTFIGLLPEEEMALLLFTNFSSIASQDAAEWILPAFFTRDALLDTLLGIEADTLQVFENRVVPL